MDTKFQENLRELVVERLKATPSNLRISIGSDGSFSKDQLIDHIDQGDEIGDKIIEIQLRYLQMMKTGALLKDE